jgi:hypothetical protein
VTGLPLVSGEVVAEVRDEFGRGMARNRFAEHLPGLGIEGGVQRQGAVTKVLKAVPFGASRGQRQNRILAIPGPGWRSFHPRGTPRVPAYATPRPTSCGRRPDMLQFARAPVSCSSAHGVSPPESVMVVTVH